MEHIRAVCNLLVEVGRTARGVFGGVQTGGVILVQREVAAQSKECRHGARAVPCYRQRLVHGILVGADAAVLMEGVARHVHTAVCGVVSTRADEGTEVARAPVYVVEHKVDGASAAVAPARLIAVEVGGKGGEPAERIDGPHMVAIDTARGLTVAACGNVGFNGIALCVGSDIAVFVRHANGFIHREILDREVLLGEKGCTKVKARTALLGVVIRRRCGINAVRADHTVKAAKAHTALRALRPTGCRREGRRSARDTVRPDTRCGVDAVRRAERRPKSDQTVLCVQSHLGALSVDELLESGLHCRTGGGVRLKGILREVHCPCNALKARDVRRVQVIIEDEVGKAIGLSLGIRQKAIVNTHGVIVNRNALTEIEIIVAARVLVGTGNVGGCCGYPKRKIFILRQDVGGIVLRVTRQLEGMDRAALMEDVAHTRFPQDTLVVRDGGFNVPVVGAAGDGILIAKRTEAAVIAARGTAREVGVTLERIAEQVAELLYRAVGDAAIQGGGVCGPSRIRDLNDGLDGVAARVGRHNILVLGNVFHGIVRRGELVNAEIKSRTINVRVVGHGALSEGTVHVLTPQHQRANAAVFAHVPILLVAKRCRLAADAIRPGACRKVHVGVVKRRIKRLQALLCVERLNNCLILKRSENLGLDRCLFGRVRCKAEIAALQNCLQRRKRFLGHARQAVVMDDVRRIVLQTVFIA